jgi:hypothetical protein
MNAWTYYWGNFQGNKDIDFDSCKNANFCPETVQCPKNACTHVDTQLRCFACYQTLIDKYVKPYYPWWQTVGDGGIVFLGGIFYVAGYVVTAGGIVLAGAVDTGVNNSILMDIRGKIKSRGERLRDERCGKVPKQPK